MAGHYMVITIEEALPWGWKSAELHTMDVLSVFYSKQQVQDMNTHSKAGMSYMDFY